MTDNPKKRRNVLVLEDEAFIAMLLEEELEAKRLEKQRREQAMPFASAEECFRKGKHVLRFGKTPTEP